MIVLGAIVLCAGQQPRDASAFACDATSFTPLDDSYGKIVISSPDEKKHIRLNQDGSFGIFVGQKRIGLPTYNVEADVEAGWSPDSTRFFIMYSDPTPHYQAGSRRGLVGGGSVH
jgi:hypothetical protein